MKYAIVNMIRCLRVKDNPLLALCHEKGYIPIPIYCVDSTYITETDSGELSTGIPRLLGTRYNWMVECIKDCKLYLEEYNLSLISLVGNVKEQIERLIKELSITKPNEIVLYSLAHPDIYERSINSQLEEVCHELGIKSQILGGYSTYINIHRITPYIHDIPHTFKGFLKLCENRINTKGDILVHIPEYSINSWSIELKGILNDLIKEGINSLNTLSIQHKNTLNIREEVLGIKSNILLEKVSSKYINCLLREGGILSYDIDKLQGTTMLSPLISLGVIAPYTLLNECLATRNIYLKNRNMFMCEKYTLLINNLFLGAYSLLVGNIERRNLFTLNSIRYNKSLDLSKYLSIEESKELINTCSLYYEGGDEKTGAAVQALLKTLMNRGYLSKKGRMIVALYLNKCNIHPYVIRDIFRGFLLDYCESSTYNGLSWCLGTSNPYYREPFIPSLVKQLCEKEYGFYNGDIITKETWISAYNSINLNAIPYFLESNRLPTRII